MLNYLIELDKALFLFLNGINSPFWDGVMYWISHKFTFVPLYAAVIYFFFKQYGWNGLLVLVMAVFTIAVADQVSSSIIKEAVHRLRPSHNPEFDQVIHLVYENRGGMYGFVSSHAANSFAFAVFTLLLFRKRWFTISILVWAAVVSYSRIYLGLHYPGDILGGAIVGVLSGMLGYTVLVRLPCFRGCRI